MTFTIDFQPLGIKASYEKPLTIIEAARLAGICIESPCGGRGRCGKCKVLTHPAYPCQPSRLLSHKEIEQGFRLACATVIDRDLTVYLPQQVITPSKFRKLPKIKDQISPVIRKYFLKLPKATSLDPRADFERIKDNILKNHQININSIDWEVLKSLSSSIRKGRWNVTVTVRHGEIIAVEPDDTTHKAYGIAIDLGTSNIGIYLVDLLEGECIDAVGITNPQIAYGSDVVTRLNFSLQDELHLNKLRQGLIKAINISGEKLCRDNGIEGKDILEIILVGNTVMHHIFLGFSPEGLAFSPFVPLTCTPLELKARDIGINVAIGAYIYLPPIVGGFVGSDLVAGLLASGIFSRKSNNYLFIDIGTNTEIALKSHKGIMACSCASGPAFEGGHLKYGMKALEGAISSVKIGRRKLHIKTVGGKPPLGICGSGIMEAIAEMLRVGILDSTGRIQPDKPRVRKTQDQCEFLLAEDKEGVVAITQQDVNMIMLAKSAIRTGIEIILQEGGMKAEELEKVIVAGSFGTSINLISAIKIGLFPPIAKFIQVGNIAGKGAIQILISNRLRKRAEKMAAGIKHIALNTKPNFSKLFANHMRF